MPRNNDNADPRGLIHESYRIDGISEAECRSIFLDWAIGVPIDADNEAYVRKLLNQYNAQHPDHPMTTVLRAALEKPERHGRRGGAGGRRINVDRESKN
ncbi:MAG: hypothetical protein ACR2OY_13840 [Boseongicola sp.]